MGYSLTHMEPEYVIFINSKFGFRVVDSGSLATGEDVFKFMHRCADLEDEGMGFFMVSIAKPKGFDQKDIRIFVSKFEPFSDSEMQYYIVNKDLVNVEKLDGASAIEALTKTHKLDFTYEI